MTYRLASSLALLTALVLAGCSSDAIETSPDNTIHPALQRIGEVTFSTDRDPPGLPPEAADELHETRKQALFAASRVVRDATDWDRAVAELEALAATAPFAADYASQQIISSIALQGVLLHAPDTEGARSATRRHVERLLAHDGIAFVAMVEAVDKVRGAGDAEAVRALETAVADRYRAHASRDCDDCPARGPEALARAAAADDGGPSVLDRMPPALREQARRSAERRRAAEDRIRSWAS